MVAKRVNQAGRAYSRDEVFTNVEAYESIISKHFSEKLLNNPNAKILIPAAGTGNDIQALLNVSNIEPANITAVEVEPDSAAEIAAKFPAIKLIVGSFI